MKKQSFLLLLLITVTIFSKIIAQNIAVNQTGNLPDTSAMLDVSSTNKGFLVPRMTTTQQNAIPLPAKGLLIYNLTDDVFKVNIGTTSSPIWTTLATGNAAAAGWGTTGNNGTTAGTNFIGTTDSKDFVTKTNGTERLRVTTSGNVGIGTNSPSTILSLSGEAAQTIGMERSTSASGNGNSLTIMAGGAPSSKGNRAGGNLILASGITTGSSTSDILFQTTSGGSSGNTDNTPTTKMTILGNGNAGINTTIPGSTLDVKGTLRLSGSTSGYVGFSPAAAAGATTYILPNADGSNGQQLTTNGSGTLTWSAAGSSSGTVSSASVVSANGFSGTVATATTTPAITLSTTITGLLKGNGTAISAATAGTDFLTPTGSAASLTNFPTFNQNTTGSAATLTTGRTIEITGDLTYTSPAFNGSGNVTAAGTLATVNSNIGSFTNANIMVNAKGLVTAVSSGTATTVGLLVDADKTTSYSPSSSYSTLIYNVAGTNVGSAYSTATGVFTAPATGLYQIMISNLYAVANSVNNTLSARIIVNNITETEVWTSLTPYSGSTIYGTLLGITVVAMTSGQTASIQTGGLNNTMTPKVGAGQHTLKIIRLN